MASSIDTVTIDCADAAGMAAFWCAALGYEVADQDDEGVFASDPGGSGVPLYFQMVPEGKTVKNRVHLDLRPPESMAKEVERVAGLGATVFRVVEVEGSFWTVMLDPEGNEFCVLRGPEDGWSPRETG
jgi:catechol 2,3-dioxygenase-like lactoylglutathione lyase family enzyme